MNKDERDILINNLTENLPVFRAKMGLSQAALANLVGISRQTLVAIERRKRKMSWKTFLACVLVFQNQPDLEELLRLYGIVPDKLGI